MSASNYWLFKWLEEYEVNDLTRARSLLSDHRAIKDLREKATGAQSSLQATATDQISIMAGRGIDLTGQLDCNHPSCRRRQVDDLFRHVWHYFDQIVVADGVAHEVSMHWNEATEKRSEWILAHIGTLLYLKEIGAESLVAFRETPPACEMHWEKHAEDAGLKQVLDYGKGPDSFAGRGS